MMQNIKNKIKENYLRMTNETDLFNKFRQLKITFNTRGCKQHGVENNQIRKCKFQLRLLLGIRDLTSKALLMSVTFLLQSRRADIRIGV